MRRAITAAAATLTAAVGITAVWHRLWVWAATRRDATLTAALDGPGPWDHELRAMINEFTD